VHLQADTLEVAVHALCAKFEVSPGAEEERKVAREHGRPKLKRGGTTFAVGILSRRHSTQVVPIIHLPGIICSGRSQDKFYLLEFEIILKPARIASISRTPFPQSIRPSPSALEL
jgi:hypothetical protein